MTPAEVGALLDDMKVVFWEAGPHGFTVGRDLEMRIERGSGIAGRGDHWALVDVPSGSRTASVNRRGDLRRLIIEWLAGPRPTQIPLGYACYAKLNHNRYGSSYVWVFRRGMKRREPADGQSVTKGDPIGF